MPTKVDSAWAEHALASLRQAGYRRGGARTAVVEALAGHDCAVTALDLDDELRRRKSAVGRASVYRALEQLE
jgi:Fur family transcriptional regulator, ferric uptake regulator